MRHTMDREESVFGMAAMGAFSLPGPRLTREADAAAKVETAAAHLAGMDVVLDPTGALYWPAERTLVVSDLHLETGSSYARTGQMLPPYDTAETLARLAGAMARHRPERVISLGDSFHDRGGPERLGAKDRATLAALGAAAHFVWVSGNHDGACAQTLAGTVCDELTLAGTLFRHIPAEGWTTGEVAGHLHPAARVVVRGRSVRRRCFVGCAERLVMPAFGCLTGGLSVADPAICGLWPDRPAPRVHLVGASRIYSL